MITTIQQTGKGLKFSLVLSWLMIIAGIALTVTAHGIGIPMSVIGAISLVVTRILIWWNHA